MAEAGIDSRLVTMLLLVATVTAASVLSFLGCRLLLRLDVVRKLPGWIVCALLWAISTAALWLISLKVMDSFQDSLALLFAIPAAALLGLVYGGGFALLGRTGKVSGHWLQRALGGAFLGAALALLAGLSMHLLLTGWGGPGGGSFHRPGVLQAAILFSWLIPLFAIAGVATPRAVLVPGNWFETKPLRDSA